VTLLVTTGGTHMIQLHRGISIGAGVLLAIASLVFLSASASAQDCIEGDCDEDNFNTGSPHVVVGELTWENRVGSSDYDLSLPNQYGSACGDDPNEYLIRERSTSEFEADTSEYACVTDYETRCLFNGEIYLEGEMRDVGSVVDSAEIPEHSPDREVCLNIDDSEPGGTFHDTDKWESTEYVRGRISEAGNREDALVSEEWRDEWREHPDPEAVSNSGEYESPEWSSYVESSGPAVPSELLDPRGGFALEDDCGASKCEDISPVVQNRHWGNFSFRGSRSDEFDNGASDFNLDIVHNRIAMGQSGNKGHGASNSQDNESFTPSNPFHESEVNEEFNEWAYTEDLQQGVGPFGGTYESDKCYGRSRESDADVSKSERLYANSFVNPDGYWINPDNSKRTVTEGGTSCDLTGDDRGIAYDTGGEVKVH